MNYFYDIPEKYLQFKKLIEACNEDVVSIQRKFLCPLCTNWTLLVYKRRVLIYDYFLTNSFPFKLFPSLWCLKDISFYICHVKYVISALTTQAANSRCSMK